MGQYVLVYHYFLATRPCEHFARFVNNPDYIFGTVDTTNDEKVFKATGLACQNILDIQCHYKILGDREKHQDSLVDLAMAIIGPYYTRMKDVYKKKKVAWHRAWIQILGEDHVKYAAKDVYVSYNLCMRIVELRKFHHHPSFGTPHHKKYR
ncbi:hypothetical protein D1007_42241 [Hordeum vulgare]|nr:hypothetical protein D1007_42241 [Hordeum vulgare]